jgi:adenine-specific DNA-methyltransferase
MRYIGSKEKLIANIFETIDGLDVKNHSICDLFSGTTTVAKYFKKRNWQVYSADLLYFSFVLQKAYIENNSQPNFVKLISTIDFPQANLLSEPLHDIISYLNNLPLKEGFIYSNYTMEGTKTQEIQRNFFSGFNGKKIDTVRTQIEMWKLQSLINDHEYYLLLASLIETVPFYANISGVYSAFFKKTDPRAIKEMYLREIEICTNSYSNKVYNGDGLDLLKNIKCDVLYLDPPYNHRQYAPNYHLLETIAKYDNPKIKGVAGIRDYKESKSLWCNRLTAISSLDQICQTKNFNYLVLSYNNEGVMKTGDILQILNKYGSVKMKEIEYLRYKSNNNGEAKHKKYIKELLFILKI